MNINLANTIFDDGIFSELYKAGFIPSKIFTYGQIYLWVQAQMKIRGITKTRRYCKHTQIQQGRTHDMESTK